MTIHIQEPRPGDPRPMDPRWVAKANDIAGNIERAFEWDERIKLGIFRRNGRHVLQMRLASMGDMHYITVDFDGRDDLRRVRYAFDQLVRNAMYLVRE